MRPIDADALIEFCAERWIPLNVDAVNMQPTVQPEKTQLSQQGTTKDTISRQAVLDRAVSIPMFGRDVKMVAVSEIKNLPSAQPEPHEGHWIRRDCGLDVECKCSRCGYKDFVEPRGVYWFKRNYCPHCGAKMKGAEHETD